MLLKQALAEWQWCGAAIMAAIGKGPPLSDSDVIGEIERLKALVSSAWEAGAAYAVGSQRVFRQIHPDKAEWMAKHLEESDE